jgi:hypothetical protein
LVGPYLVFIYLVSHNILQKASAGPDRTVPFLGITLYLLLHRSCSCCCQDGLVVLCMEYLSTISVGRCRLSQSIDYLSKEARCGVDAVSSMASSSKNTSPSKRGDVVDKKTVRVLGGAAQVTVVRGETVSEKGSVFLAMAAYEVKTEQEARATIGLLRQESAFSGATHLISAFRCSIDGTEGSDDDGETRAGGKLLGILRKINARGVSVVVARWYGGVNIGKARFRHICDRASKLLVGCGLTGEPGSLMEAAWHSAGVGTRLGMLGEGTGPSATSTVRSMEEGTVAATHGDKKSEIRRLAGEAAMRRLHSKSNTHDEVGVGEKRKAVVNIPDHDAETNSVGMLSKSKPKRAKAEIPARAKTISNTVDVIDLT